MSQIRLERESAAAQVGSGLTSSWFLMPAHTLPATLGARSTTSGRLMVGLGVASAAAMFLSNAIASPDCRTKPVTLVLGRDRDISITTPAKTACTIIQLRIGGTSIHELSIDSPPKSGALRSRGRTGITYRPNGKFVGEDSFSFAVRGRLASERKTSEQTSIIRVKATIR